MRLITMFELALYRDHELDAAARRAAADLRRTVPYSIGQHNARATLENIARERARRERRTP